MARVFLHIGTILTILYDNNLKLAATKCNLFRPSVIFLGHTVSKEGLCCEASKIEAIKNYPTPTTVKEVRQAIGLFSYYRRYVSNFSAIAKPLHTLTTKNAAFYWSEDCENAFRTLIQKLVTAPVLATPQEGDEFVLTTDCSEQSMGAVLSVTRNGERHPVAFGSRLLNPTQSKYSSTKRELQLLAIVYFLQAFRFFLLGTHVQVEWTTAPFAG